MVDILEWETRKIKLKDEREAKLTKEDEEHLAYIKSITETVE